MCVSLRIFEDLKENSWKTEKNFVKIWRKIFENFKYWEKHDGKNVLKRNFKEIRKFLKIRRKLLKNTKENNWKERNFRQASTKKGQHLALLTHKFFSLSFLANWNMQVSRYLAHNQKASQISINLTRNKPTKSHAYRNKKTHQTKLLSTKIKKEKKKKSNKYNNIWRKKIASENLSLSLFFFGDITIKKKEKKSEIRT